MIIKVFPDKEKAKSIIDNAEGREQFIKIKADSSFSTFIVESYYEIIKEFSTASLVVYGNRFTNNTKINMVIP